MAALKKVPFTEVDYLRVRNFLVNTLQANPVNSNWQIDRWNFCRFVSQTIHETTQSWPGSVGLWVDEAGEIQAVVNSEGENRGEAFFQLAPRDYTDVELKEFLDHAEQNLALRKESGERSIDLHIGTGFQQLVRILEKRGFQRAGEDPGGVLEITGLLEVILPEGLQLVDGADFSDQQRGLAHSLAFGYAREGKDVLQKYHIVEAFTNMRRAPDYRSDLDLAVLTQDGEVAAFVNFWYDEVNRIAILEPLGTIPAYQKQGVARAMLSEGINRLFKLGAEKLYGGYGKPFYGGFGFRTIKLREIWRKEW